MIFLSDSTLLGVDEIYISYTPTNLNSITRVEMQNAWFNDLFVWSQDGDPDGIMPEFNIEIPEEWDFNTVMRAEYEENTSAGNVDWDLSILDYVIIKRKKLPVGTYKETEENKWMTFKVNDVSGIEPYDDKCFYVNLSGTDLTAGNGTYVYAVVPIFSGGVEGAYYEINKPLEVSVDRVVIVDKEETWSTIFVDNGVSIQHVMPSQAIETMYSKYPTIISNGDSNYRTVTVDTKWLPMNPNCDFDEMDNDIERVEYNDNFLRFLHNKNAKILKAQNGRLFLIWITTPASISVEDNSDIVEKVSFGGTEIGSVYDEELLYKTGFTSVSSEWWIK